MLKKIVFALVILIISNSFFELTAKDYKGAEYRTKEQFLYGRFEVSYIPANREGVVSSFFTYRDPDSNSADWNEIDIEFVGRYSNVIQFNTITLGQTSHLRSNFIDFDPFTEFHTYAFEWTPDYVAWFVDDIEVYRQTGEHISTIKWPQNIMMNIWNPIWTNWVGTWQDNALPAFSYYDWVSYSAYTPGEGDHGTDNNFTLQWRDEFDFWDEDRWDLATHTFPGNQCDFLPDNIVFADGKMILCLTNDVETGYVDMVKPEVKWVRENFDNTITVMFTEELDEATASIKENYLISGVEISNVILSDDIKSVLLETNNYDKENFYTLIVLNVQDNAVVPNKIDLKGTTIIKSNPLEFPVRINVGGQSWGGYLEDQEWGENVEYGYWAGDVYYWQTVTDVLNTDDDEIFKSERVGLTTYKIRVPNGTYNISLLFAKNDNDIAGDRIFDIVAENQLIRNDIDILALAGKSTAYQIETEVTVEDELIDLYFPEEVDSAFVNGIIIEQLATDIQENRTENIFNHFELDQNYPNPFNPETNISYTLPENSQVSLMVYDLLGEEIELLVSEKQVAGSYSINFNASKYPSGIYFYRLATDGNNPITKKMVLLK
ncbi:MAG: family 16 glycosylhydrolase [Melioribacteraceae bacterium]|nr:family 16 glycosylhydrolase [Melioribacteraceae bacterium]